MHHSHLKLLLLTSAATVALLLGACQAHRNAADPTSGAAESDQSCRNVGAWLDPSDGGTRVAADRLLASLAQQRVVLLGERHNAAEHHRWQLHTLAGLFAHQPRLVLGFEMFPRSVQPVLDAWTAGRYSVEEFLTASRWSEVWGYDPDLYLPLFHFARQNRLPMIALNVERELVSRVGRVGWSEVPSAAKEGLSDPAPAASAYRQSLAQVYLMEQRHSGRPAQPQKGEDQAGAEEDDGMDDPVDILQDEGFNRFVEAQLTWDRAMAEALYDAAIDDPEALVVGVLGRGHIEQGYGVPHQLDDLGQSGVATLLPLDGAAACRALEPDVADAVFVLAAEDDQPPAPDKPRLGIALERAEGGILVRQVMDGSVAEAAGLAPGDVITGAAGVSVAVASELIEIIQRQAPGTWLPIEVRRDDQVLRLVAKFPTLSN